jgi:hypothetical protein
LLVHPMGAVVCTFVGVHPMGAVVCRACARIAACMEHLWFRLWGCGKCDVCGETRGPPPHHRFQNPPISSPPTRPASLHSTHDGLADLDSYTHTCTAAGQHIYAVSHPIVLAVSHPRVLALKACCCSRKKRKCSVRVRAPKPLQPGRPRLAVRFCGAQASGTRF